MTQLPSPVGPNPSLPQPVNNTTNRTAYFANVNVNPLTPLRWHVRAAGIAETGGNAGSGLVADAFDDNGNNLGNAFIIERQQPGNFYLGRKIVPPQDTGQIQAGNFYGIYAGTGVPNNANGVNGDYYLRGDTPGTLNQRVYVKSAGAWVGIL